MQQSFKIFYSCPVEGKKCLRITHRGEAKATYKSLAASASSLSAVDGQVRRVSITGVKSY